MVQCCSHFGNFLRRGFDFTGRASLLEYWAVMPVIWTAMAMTLAGDFGRVSGFLQAGAVPPLHPLHYSSIVLFALVFLPSLSLTVRRLHDSNRSAIYAVIPLIVFVGLVAILSGFVGAMMHSSLIGVSDNPDHPGHILVPLNLLFTDSAAFWDEIFAISDVFEATGIQTFQNLIAEVHAQNGAVDIRRSNTDLSVGIVGDLMHTYGVLLFWFVLFSIPVVGLMGQVLFMSLSSSPGENAYGPARSAVSGRPLAKHETPSFQRMRATQ